MPNRAPGAHRGLRKYRGRPAGAMARWGAAFRALYGRLVSAAAHSLACLGFVCSRRVGWSLVPRGAAHSGLPKPHPARCGFSSFQPAGHARMQKRPRVLASIALRTRGPDGSLISMILFVQSSCCTRERK